MLKHLSGASALGFVHGAVVEARNRLYDTGRLRTARIDRPVISVGNLASGGTGKTPFTLEVARLLSGEGHVVAILSRGYGGVRSEEPMLVSDLRRIRHGATEAGDEPFLLARRLPGVPVVVGADRLAAARLALATAPVQVFILDDGFQHRSLARDIDLVLLDAGDPWAGGLMPGGRLREKPAALRRAHGIVLTRLHQTDAARLKTLREELARVAPDVPVFGTRTFLTGVREAPHGEKRPVESLRGMRVLAFAGLARPQSFFSDVAAVGAQVVATRAFADHHPYSVSDMRDLARRAEESGALALVTTEKDAVRMPPPPPGMAPVHVLRLRLVPDDPAALLRLLAAKLPGPSRGGRPVA
jgi:tetraacyldisaccharide 4'-kinase